MLYLGDFGYTQENFQIPSHVDGWQFIARTAASILTEVKLIVTLGFVLQLNS